MKETTVSIIVPVYNSESTIEKCVESILNQTYLNLEIILIDDGSKDDSLKVCKQYAQTDNRIVVLHHQNLGVSFTRNSGLDAATGEYVMFIDADDTVSPNWVEKYVEAIHSFGADLVIGGLTIKYQDGNNVNSIPPILGILESEIWKYICETESGVFGYVPNKLYKREIISDIRFNENMTVQEDFAFALDVYANAKKIALIDETGYYYKFALNKRSTPFLDLISNQMKLLQYTRKLADCSTVSFGRLSELVVGWTYQYLYESDLDRDFIKKCIAVREIQDIDFLTTMCKKHNEKTYIYRLIKKGKYKIVKMWFSLRRITKKCIGFRRHHH